jgi:hypothetical protein
MAYWSTQGTIVQVQHTNGTFININGVESFDIQGGAADQVSIKPLEASSATTFPGSPGDITVSMPLFWDPTSESHQFLLTRKNNTTALNYKALLPFAGTNNVLTFAATVSQFTPTIQGNNAGRTNVELLMSGDWSV